MFCLVKVLFAAEQHPELRPLILRRFKGSGDLAQAVSLIENSNGILRAKELAKHHSLMAADMVSPGP
jgi:geranylgeranyl pyrophosphate synthase